MKRVLAVSGVKNSGKTTLIDRMIPVFVQQGLKVAVIKHDGHEFEADVPGTDSWKHKKAGAYGTAVFSSTKYMIVKEEPDVDLRKLTACFPEADLILFEGGKFLDLPKIELVRREISKEPVCAPESVAAYVTDFLDGLPDSSEPFDDPLHSDLAVCGFSGRKDFRMPDIPGWMKSGIPVFGYEQADELCTYLLKKVIKNDKIKSWL